MIYIWRRNSASVTTTIQSYFDRLCEGILALQCFLLSFEIDISVLTSLVSDLFALLGLEKNRLFSR